jgi:hypothetical protein
VLALLLEALPAHVLDAAHGPDDFLASFFQTSEPRPAGGTACTLPLCTLPLELGQLGLDD